MRSLVQGILASCAVLGSASAQSVQVDLKDLDLASCDNAVVAISRLERASRIVCRRELDTFATSTERRVRACTRELLWETVDELENGGVVADVLTGIETAREERRRFSCSQTTL